MAKHMHGPASELTKLEFLAAQMLVSGDTTCPDEDIKWAFDVAEKILAESERRQQVEREAAEAAKEARRKQLQEERERAPFFVQAWRDRFGYWGGVGRVGYEEEDWVRVTDLCYESEAEALAASRTWAQANGTLAPEPPSPDEERPDLFPDPGILGGE